MIAETIRSLVAAAAAAAVMAAPAAAQPARTPPEPGPSASDAPEFVPGEVLVRFKPTVDGAERAEVRRDEGVSFEENLPLPGVQRVDTDRGTSVREAARGLESRPEVAYAQPNFVRSVAKLPHDGETLFQDLWALQNTGRRISGVEGTAGADISAPAAWNLETGARRVVAAVVDTGVDYEHPDLAANIWHHPRSGSPGRDFCGGTVKTSSGSGCDGVGDSDPTDEHKYGHGTHVAGTIGGDGHNGAGLVGVNWQVRLMPVRVANADGWTTDALLARGFNYAAANGAKVVNASFGGAGAASDVLVDAVRRWPRTLFVVAAGNGDDDPTTKNVLERKNNDKKPDFLCNIDSPNLVCVTASDQDDHLADFGNYGVKSVDLAAPGVNVLSTSTNPTGYRFLEGTSMATPHVAGVAALGFAHAPRAKPSAMRRALMAGVDRSSELALATGSAGRLNARRTLKLLTSKPPAASITSRPKARTRNRRPTFRFSASRAATTFECRLDGGAVTGRGSYSGCSSRLRVPRLGDGFHKLQVRARGAAGTTVPWRRAEDFRLYVDRTAPRMGISGPLELRRRRVPVDISCPASERFGRCSGRIEVRSKWPVKVGKRRHRINLGRSGFAIRRGDGETAAIGVSLEHRRVIQRRGRLPVVVRAVASDFLGNTGATSKRARLIAD